MADWLIWLIDLLYLLIFGFALRNWLRQRTRANFDSLLLFGTIAVLIALQALDRVLAGSQPWLRIVNGGLLISLAYLLLRLLENFRTIPLVQRLIGGGGLVVSWLILILVRPLNLALSLLLVAYFICVTSYCAVGFLRLAMSHVGVTRRRLLFVAFGTMLLAAVILLAGFRLSLPALRDLLGGLAQACSLASGFAYYLGFSPPRWLRRLWRQPEVDRFLREKTELQGIFDRHEAADRLADLAAQGLGVRAGTIALWDDRQQCLTMPWPLALTGTDRERAQYTSALGEGTIGRAAQGMRPIWLTQFSDTSPIRIEVIDTGVGIPPDQLERIWDRFYQVEGSATRRFGGMGLGLAIVKDLVTRQGGEVWARSEGTGKGATFGFSLPTQATEMAAEEPQTSRDGTGTVEQDGAESSSNTVVVVEDDPAFAEILESYLRSEGYEVVQARDGETALTLARQIRPFAITLDVQLPRLDGWSVLNALKQDPATRDIPVLGITIVENRAFGLSLGAVDYLVKPLQSGQLDHVLTRLAQHRPHRGEILVVEDDPALLDTLATTLRAEQWQVRTATNGREALATLAGSRPELMVLDLMLPEMNGFEVIEQVRADPATRDLAIVIVTAKDLTLEERQRLGGETLRLIRKGGRSAQDILGEIGGVLRSWPREKQVDHTRRSRR